MLKFVTLIGEIYQTINYGRARVYDAKLYSLVSARFYVVVIKIILCVNNEFYIVLT